VEVPEPSGMLLILGAFFGRWVRRKRS